MPKKTVDSKTEQFSITLPKQAVEMLEELVPSGLFGSSRGEVARTLILGRLEQLASQSMVKLRR